MIDNQLAAVVTNHIDRDFLAQALTQAAEERAKRETEDAEHQESERQRWSNLTAEKLAKVGIIVDPATGRFDGEEYIEFEVEGLIFKAPGNRVFVRIAPQRLPNVYEYTITKHWKNIASVACLDSPTAAADLALEIAKLEENLEQGWESYRAAQANPVPEVKPEPTPDPLFKFVVCNDMTLIKNREEFEHDLTAALNDGWQLYGEPLMSATSFLGDVGEFYRTVYVQRLKKASAIVVDGTNFAKTFDYAIATAQRAGYGDSEYLGAIDYLADYVNDIERELEAHLDFEIEEYDDEPGFDDYEDPAGNDENNYWVNPANGLPF